MKKLTKETRCKIVELMQYTYNQRAEDGRHSRVKGKEFKEWALEQIEEKFNLYNISVKVIDLAVMIDIEDRHVIKNFTMENIPFNRVRSIVEEYSDKDFLASTISNTGHENTTCPEFVSICGTYKGATTFVQILYWKAS